MGFLQKGWDWESGETAEMEKPQGDRKLWLWALALLCFGLSVFVMYHTEYTIYGGVIETNAVGYGIALLGAGIGVLLRDEEEPKKPKVQKPWKKWTGRIVVAACVVFLLWAIYTWKGFFIIGLQTLCLLPMGAALERKEKQTDADKRGWAAWNILLSYAILALATIIAPKILGLSTVQEETERLAGAGYEKIAYVSSIEGHWLDIPFETAVPLPEEEADMEMYLFSGEKEGALWGIAIDPWTGKILAEEQAEENGNLVLWLME